MSSPTTTGSRPVGYDTGDDDRAADEGEVVELERPSSGVSLGRIAVSLVAVLAIVGAIYLLDTGRGNGASATSINVPGSTGPAPRVGEPAPDFELPNLDGKTVKLSDYKGQPVWINFWASWCPPCRAETPDVEAAYKERHPQGLTLLAISIGEDAAAVRNYVQAAGMTSTILVDSSQGVASRYHINGIPTHLFVDKDGIVRALVSGGLNRSTIGQRLDLIMR